MEWANNYAERYGYDPKTLDAEAWYDSTLSYSENQEIIKGAYPPVKSADQMIEDEGKRNTDQYAKYANVEGSRQRMEEVKKARKPSLSDKLGELKEKYIDEPARKRETEHYFKTQKKIRERQEHLKVKLLDREERRLAREEGQLDKEAFNASFAGRTLEAARNMGRGFSGYGRQARPIFQPSYSDTNTIRGMLTPSNRTAQSSSPLFSGGSQNSVVLGLLTGKSNQPKQHRHYVTVIQHGQAKRVYVGEGQQYGQPQPPQPTQGLSLLDMGGNNVMRERLALGRAKYGFSLSSKKKMPKFL